MKIAIAIVYTPDWQGMADVVLPNIREYAKRHNYEVYVRVDPNPYNGFSKLTLLSYLFKVVKCDVVMNMDLDSNITRHDIKIEDYLEDGKDFYLCKDINSINCGVFISRNTIWTLQLIAWCLTREGKVDCEQNAIEDYMIFVKYNYTDRPFKILEQGFNDYPLDEYKPSYGKWGYNENDVVERPINDWNENSFIIHIPGLPYTQRLSILKTTPIIK